MKRSKVLVIGTFAAALALGLVSIISFSHRMDIADATGQPGGSAVGELTGLAVSAVLFLAGAVFLARHRRVADERHGATTQFRMGLGLLVVGVALSLISPLFGIIALAGLALLWQRSSAPAQI